ncbi:YceI family protein [uncultured Dokdonia sp.]|uniref:YceI family protein n=1 Tax=uncultured Dokdonia sp. TaxID=575653 RepID=UPI00260E4455|nr:YceI family protein [uncultured Dokdonia sp.]
MKTRLFTAILALIVTGAFATNPVKKEVKVKDATITWVGKKVTGSHTGTIDLQEGTLIMDGNTLVGGSFTVNMTSLQVTDLEAGKGKEKLEGHLKTDEFFGVNNFPTATFTITDVAQSGDGYSVVGNMTIKGITQPMKIRMNINGNTASTKLDIDRTKYGITYGSGSFFDNLKDKAIDDNFELAVSLTF